jgi:hypothetical protein
MLHALAGSSEPAGSSSYLGRQLQQFPGLTGFTPDIGVAHRKLAQSAPDKGRAVATSPRTFHVFRSTAKPHVSSLGGFVDSLTQTFENRRAGLPDGVDEAGASRYFSDIYEKELPRLAEMVSTIAPELSRSRAESFYREVDSLMRSTVIPAYTRLAVKFTPRERNDFFLVKEHLRGAERLGWTVAGLALGGFVVWAPFIPLWSKEWVIPFMIGGFFFPNLRRYLAFSRYEKEINKVVESADAEIQRMNIAYLTSDQTGAESSAVESVHDGAPMGRSQKDRVH